MRHVGRWGNLKSLDEGWWCATPPTAIMESPSGSAQLFVASLLVSVGYRPGSSYAFGAALGADCFYTGNYTPGPIEWVLQRLNRPPSPVYLIGLKVADDHWPTFERLADHIPRIGEVADNMDASHAADLVPFETFGDIASPLLKMLSSINKIDYCPQGIVWPRQRWQPLGGSG
jgi:hypothetical protein